MYLRFHSCWVSPVLFLFITKCCCVVGMYFFLPHVFLIHLFICAYIVWAISPPCLPPLASPPNLSPFQADPVLPFSPILLKRRHKHNKKDSVFASWDKNSYTERYLALLPCTCVLQPELIYLYQTSLLLLRHLPILTSVVLRLLY
jgi:hypothetical protein